jgi:hypothetical protein
MKKLFTIIALLVILFFSCKKDPNGTYWDTHLLGPLVNASLSIDNLLPDSILQSNPDSSMKIVYENEVYKLSVDTLFKIPDTTLRQMYTIPFPVTFNPGQTVINNSTSETTYSLPGVQLRTSTVKSGFVHYKIKSYITEKTNFVYSIPSAKLNGAPFQINVVVPAAVGNAPGVYDETYDLAGYIIDLTGIYHNKVNTIATSFTASVSQDAQPVLVNNSDSIIIENTFYDIIPYYAKGYFGQNTFNIGPSSTDFSLFKRIVGGTLKLEDVNFNFKIRNPIGLDARIFISDLSSVNTRTGTTVSLSNSIIGSPININRASESGGIVYPYNVSFPLTTSNSNIKPMVENLPDKFTYSMQITANPLGNISGSNDFIYSDNLLDASLDIEIPLSLVATDLTLVDTLNLNVSGKGAEDLKSGTFTLFAENGFPFDAALQMYMLDDMNAIADSLFQNINTIDEAPVNSSLRVINKRLTKLAVPLSEAKMSRLMNTKKLIIKVKFNTSEQPQYIKIYSDYSIDVKLVGDINYTVHLN